MGTLKKYHFILYINEDQELAVRQLFLLNKWELHSKALSQLTAILDDVIKNTTKSPTDNTDTPSQEVVQDKSSKESTVQNGSHQLLSLQKMYTCNSANQSSETNTTIKDNKKTDTCDLAAEILSASVKDVEKEAAGKDTCSVLNESLQSGPVVKGSSYSSAENMLDSGTNLTQSYTESALVFQGYEKVTETKDHRTYFEEVKKLSDDKNLETEKEITNLATSASNSNPSSHNKSCSGINLSSEMDPLARASEIAGIPFQQPDGTLQYAPDSFEYNRYENLYQISSDSFQQQTVQEFIQPESQSHSSGIEQLLRASAVVPPQDKLQYSQSGQCNLHCSPSHPPSVNNQENMIFISSLHAKADSADTSILHYRNNVDRLEECQDNASGCLVSCEKQTTDTGSLITNKENHSNNCEMSIVVPFTSIIVKPNLSKKEKDKSNGKHCHPGENVNKTFDAAGVLNTETESNGMTHGKDYVELKINGSLLKIPVVFPCGTRDTKQTSRNDFSQLEGGELLKQDLNSKVNLDRKVDHYTKKDKDSEKNHILDSAERKIKDGSNSDADNSGLSLEDNKNKMKRKINLQEDKGVNKRMKYGKTAEKRLSNPNETPQFKKEGDQINKGENKKVIDTGKKTAKQEERMRDTDEGKKILIPKLTKTYSTRFRVKKEMLENIKKKKIEKEKMKYAKAKSKEENNKKRLSERTNNKKLELIRNADISEKSMTEKKLSKGVSAEMPGITKDPRNSERNNSKKNSKCTYNKKTEILRDSKNTEAAARTHANKGNETEKDNKKSQEHIKCMEKMSNLETNTSEMENSEGSPEGVTDSVIYSEDYQMKTNESDHVKVEVKEEIETDDSHDTVLIPDKKKIKKAKSNNLENKIQDSIIHQTSECPDCGKFFNKKGYCKFCKLSCPVCGKSFTRSPSAMKQYQKHMKKHSDDPKPYPCNECDTKFSSEWFLNRHIENKHINNTDVGPFVCEICQKIFTTKYSLKGHISSIHGERKRDVLCDLCGDFFLSQGYLRQHRQYVHQEKRNFTCRLCFVSVKTEVLLKRHMARHTEEKNEVCNICGRSFRVRSDLLRHMIRHDNNRRVFKCETCGKSFFEDQKLKQHVRIHTGVKPFKCHLCQYACAVKGNLTKHLKTHAKNEGYLGRAYRRKSKGTTAMNEQVSEQGPPVQLQIEVITTAGHVGQEMPQYEGHEQELAHFETDGHELIQYEVSKQELQHYETAQQELLHSETNKQEVSHFETGKQEVSHFETGKQEVSHFETEKQEVSQFEAEKQELSHFEEEKPGLPQYEVTAGSLEQENEHFEAVRTETDPLRAYYETVHPAHMEAGRVAYLDQAELKESADSENYLNQLHLAMIANSYRNVNVSKIDFYNI